MAFLQALVLPLLLAVSAPPDGGFLGVYVQDSEAGPVVSGVIDGTAAARAGFREGDRFVSIDGKKTPNQSAFLEVLGAYDPGDRVRIVFVRGDDEMTKRVRLGRRPANIETGEEAEEHEAEEREGGEHEGREHEGEEAAEHEETEERGERSGLRRRGSGQPFLGVQIEDGDEGLVVVRVVDDSPAARAGVKAGDRIVAMGERKIGDGDDLGAALGKTEVGQRVGMMVRRGDDTVRLRVRIGSRGGAEVASLEDVTNERKEAEGARKRAMAEARKEREKAMAQARKEREKARAMARKERDNARKAREKAEVEAGAQRSRAAREARSTSRGSDESVRALRGEIRDLRREIAELRKLVKKLDRDR